MSVYVVGGTLTATGFLCIKASSTLPVKLIRVDANDLNAYLYTVYEYTGGGTITGGTSPTPVPLRSTAPPALAVVKLTATAISGTQNTLQPSKSIAAATPDSFTPPSSVVLAQGSSSVIAAAGVIGTTFMFWFDELEIQPGY